MSELLLYQGRHTVFTHWPDGKITMWTDWDKLEAEVREAIANAEAAKAQAAKPIRRRQRKAKHGKQS